VVGAGTGVHDSVVVVGRAVVVGAALIEVESARVDGIGTVVDDERAVVVGSVELAFLLLLQAPAVSARQHPTIAAVRTSSSWHR
jgi:hypothetical protein